MFNGIRILAAELRTLRGLSGALSRFICSLSVVTWLGIKGGRGFSSSRRTLEPGALRGARRDLLGEMGVIPILPT